MTFAEYQEGAASTAIYPKHLAVIYPALGLAGEAGEAANKVKKVFRDSEGMPDPAARAAIAKEIGGVLWYCAALASDLGFCLGKIAETNLTVLSDRQARGVLGGSGDDR